MLLTLAQGYFPALRSRKGVIELIVGGGGSPATVNYPKYPVRKF